MTRKTVYVPSGPSDVQCACGAQIEMKNFKHPGSGEVVQFGGCPQCNLDYEVNEAHAGISKFSKIIYIHNDHHVHCQCGDHVHMQNFKHPGSNELLSIGYCLPCSIEVRTV
jgi:predicted nucleic-acid-binding Zn-ribbon protein